MSGPRVLILTADIGAGHDLPAELLADALRERGAEPVIEDGVRAMGRIAVALLRTGAETILNRLRPFFDFQYWLATGFAPTRRLSGLLLQIIGGRGLLRLIARERPDVIVSTYPATTEALGRLRARGRVPVPCASAITDLAALGFWAHPGIDLHLLIHAESTEEVAQIIGRRDRVVTVRGLVRPAFEHPPSREQARASLGLGADGPIVLVSGGGWGIGDVEQTAAAALALPDVRVVCLCGTNVRLAERLRARYAGDTRVRVEGFTDRMADWLAAVDVLVHSTAGLTMLEAQLCGTWAVSYGWGIAHIRINNAAYRRFGLAEVVSSLDELQALLPRLLAAPRPRPAGYAELPAAAHEVLTLATRPALSSAR